MVGIHQKDDVGLADFFTEGGSVLRTSRGIDDSGSHILGRADARGDCDLWENGLDLVTDEDILDERGDEARLAGAFVAANTDAS